MDERPIWRPNSISPEEWAELTREEQVRRWKEQQPKPVPPLHPLHAVKVYNQGVITDVEFPSLVWGRLTEENVGEFLDQCPRTCLALLQKDSDRLPKDEDVQGWQGLISIRGGCYVPWATEEEIKQAEEAQDRAFREGLRVYRKAARDRSS